MNVFWIAQSIGAVALAIAVFSYQSKTRNRLLNRQIVSSVFFIVHFVLLSAWTGVLVNIIVVIRNLVFARKETHTWANHFGWVLFFFALSGGALYFSWQGLISLFPVASVLIGTYGRWQERAAQIRIYALVGCLLWIPYTLVVHSYAGTATQLIAATGVLVGMFRHDEMPIFRKDINVLD